MRYTKLLMVAVLALASTQAQAAIKDYRVKCRLAINQDGRILHETRHQNYGFRVEIVADSDGILSETSKNGYPFLTAVKDERYSVRIYNPLPVRVAMNLTVDGLNSITGKPSGISDGSKWMIDPQSWITIPGWQVNGGEARRFYFTDKPKSYAKWRGDQLGRDLEANCGVIGAAFFWNQMELDQYFDDHPIYRMTQHYTPYAVPESSMDGAAPAAPCPMEKAKKSEAELNENRALDKDLADTEAQQQAGTGMGERESHPTYEVSFNYDAGMYSLSQALVIYYDFAKISSPNPFPGVQYAPEMP